MAYIIRKSRKGCTYYYLAQSAWVDASAKTDFGKI
jgi:hypothetical protein